MPVSISKPKDPEHFRKSTADRTARDFLAELERYSVVANLPIDMYVAYASTYSRGEVSRFWDMPNQLG